MLKLTVVILTKNESLNIVDCVENAKQVTDDVLVIDSGSTDSTVELAKQAGARVVYRALENDFSAQRNFAVENSEAEWLLHLDADERMNEELIVEVNKVLKEGKQARYEFNRYYSAFGKDFKHGALGPNTVIRLFPRLGGRWENKVHESYHSDAPVVRLNGYLQHFAYRDYEHYLMKMDMYSDIAAQDYLEKGKRAGWVHLVAHPLIAFIKTYFLQGGFLDGEIGWILSLTHANYTFEKYAKLYLLQYK